MSKARKELGLTWWSYVTHAWHKLRYSTSRKYRNEWDAWENELTAITKYLHKKGLLDK